MSKLIGKINSVRFGHGGYQGAMLGFSFDLRSGSTGTGDFWGFWYSEPSHGSKWDENDQTEKFGEAMQRVNKLMEDAKVDDFAKLAGKPVEMEFSEEVNPRLVSWRILTEVL